MCEIYGMCVIKDVIAVGESQQFNLNGRVRLDSTSRKIILTTHSK